MEQTTIPNLLPFAAAAVFRMRRTRMRLTQADALERLNGVTPSAQRWTQSKLSRNEQRLDAGMDDVARMCVAYNLGFAWAHRTALTVALALNEAHCDGASAMSRGLVVALAREHADRVVVVHTWSAALVA